MKLLLKVLVLCSLSLSTYGNVLLDKKCFVFLEVDLKKEFSRHGFIDVKVYFKNFSNETIEVISPVNRLDSGAFKLHATSIPSKNFSNETMFTEEADLNRDYKYLKLKPNELKVITVKLFIQYPDTTDILKISYFPTKKDNVITAPVFLKFISLKK